MNEWSNDNIRKAIDEATQQPLSCIDFFDQFCKEMGIVHFKEGFFHFLRANDVSPYVEWNELAKQWSLYLDKILEEM